MRGLQLYLRHNPENNEIETYHKKGYRVGSFYNGVSKALIPLMYRGDVQMECKITDPGSFILVEVTVSCAEASVAEMLEWVEKMRSIYDKDNQSMNRMTFKFVRKLDPNADTDTSGCESDSDSVIDDLIKKSISQALKKATDNLAAANKKKRTPAQSAAAAAKKAAAVGSTASDVCHSKPSFDQSAAIRAMNEVAAMVQTRREDRQAHWGQLVCGVDTHILGLVHHPGYAEIDDYMALIPDYPNMSNHDILWAINGRGEIVGNLPRPVSREVAPLIRNGTVFCTVKATGAATKTKQLADLYIYYKEGAAHNIQEVYGKLRYITTSQPSISFSSLTRMLALPEQSAPPLNMHDVNRPNEVILGVAWTIISGNLDRRDILLEGVFPLQIERVGETRDYRLNAHDTNNEDFGQGRDGLAAKIGPYMKKGRVRCFGSYDGRDMYNNTHFKVAVLLKMEHVKYRNKIRDAVSSECKFIAADLLPVTPMTVGNVLNVPGYRDTDIDLQAVFGPPQSAASSVGQTSPTDVRSLGQDFDQNPAGRKRARMS
jgi:hypothetical protein